MEPRALPDHIDEECINIAAMVYADTLEHTMHTGVPLERASMMTVLPPRADAESDKAMRKIVIVAVTVDINGTASDVLAATRGALITWGERKQQAWSDSL